MHTAMMIAGGLLLLALFWSFARVTARSLAEFVTPFLTVWAIITVVNGAIGVITAGYSVLDEALVAIPVFGVPAIAAWLLARRS